VSASVHEHRLPSRLLGIVWGGVFAFSVVACAVGVVAAVVEHWPGWVAALFAAIPVAALVPLMAGTVVRLGPDGIAVRWLGSRRFHAYADLEAVEPYESPGPGEESPFQRVARTGILLRRKDGKRVLLVTRATLTMAGETPPPDAYLNVLLHAIHVAMKPHERALDRATAFEHLARGGREPVRWLRELVVLARGAGGAGAGAGYRVQGIDQLWEVLEDPAASADRRAAAAVVLRAAGGDSDAAPRIRVASEGCADPDLRAALDAVTGDVDENELARRLGRCRT
jgi:hypothetical protein